MTLEEYKRAEEKRLEINIKHMERGVRFVDINTAYIGEDVIIGAGTLIGPCVSLEGKTEIGADCIILQNTRIVDSVIADHVEI